MRYDGAAINAHWGNVWPADASDPTNPDHEMSPVLQAPVANLLGPAWELECGSPGGDYVTWLYESPAEGVHHVGVSPASSDRGVHWYICAYVDDMGEPGEMADGPGVDASPEAVVEWIKGFFTEHGYTFPDPGRTATAVRISAPSGNRDNDYWQAQCSSCSWKGSSHSNRTVEGKSLAERDAEQHKCKAA